MLTRYLFYTWECMYVNRNLPLRPTLSFPHCVQLSSLRPPVLPASASLFLPCKWFHLHHFSRFHIYVLVIQYLFFSFWLTSLCVTGSRLGYLSTTYPNVFLFMADNIPLHVYKHHLFSVHSSVDGHVGCFHVLAVINSAAVTVGVHVSFWIVFFSEYMPSSGIAGS